MARHRYALLSLLVAILLLALLAWGGWWSWVREGPLQTEVTVLVPKGTTVNALADRLERQGVIRSAMLFKLWARPRKLTLIRGEYLFGPRVNLETVMGMLRRGEIHTTAVNITPAMHAWGVQKRLKDFIPEEAFWKLWTSRQLTAAAGFPEATNLEGLLAPATYKLHHALEPEEILLEMVTAFRQQVYPKLEGGLLPPYETLILASLVEKETSLPGERPMVAGVYAKRLEIGMRLQCDPTCLYARWIDGDLRFTPPTTEDIHRPHPFNTYTNSGLPPTPIAIPGRAAVDAARNPEPTQNLYFVATGLGGHRFAPNLGEHNRNVGKFRETIRQIRNGRGATRPTPNVSRNPVKPPPRKATAKAGKRAKRSR